MRTIITLGPIETEGGRIIHLCFSISLEKGTVSEEGSTALEALQRLHAKGLTRDATCEPGLAAEARKLGLKVAALEDEAVALKAALAVLLDHRDGLETEDDPDVLLKLILAAADFEADAPWESLPPDAAIDLQVKGVSSSARPAEAMVLGHGGTEFGIALYYQRGAVKQVERLISQGREVEARAMEMLTLFLDDGPEFVTQAVDDFTEIPVAPHLVHMRRGAPVRLSREDVEVLTAALHAIRRLAAGAAEGLGRSGGSFKVEVVARLRRPGELTDAPAQPSFAKVGRNDPCPCGSGKKFKRCHAGAEQNAAAPQAPAQPVGSSWHAVDNRLRTEIAEHALQRFGRNKLQSAARTLHGDREPSPELLMPWSLYEFPLDGTRSAAEVFRSDKGNTLDATERELLDAQLASRITMLEVLEVKPEEGLRLLDLFSGESFFVKEKSGTRTLVARDVVLGRTIHLGGEHLLAGVHQSSLPPEKAEALLEKLGGATNFGLPPRPPPPAPELVRHWDEAVSALAIERASPMVMTNTDEEPLLFVEQTFAFKRGTRDELVDRLAGLEHVIIDKDTASAVELTFTKPGNAMHSAWKSTVLGSAKVTKSSLVFHTNSEARAATLRSRMEEVAGHLLTFKSRKDEKPPEGRGGQKVAIDSEARTMAGPVDPGSLMARANRDWLDEPLPALGDRTARDAVKDPALRWKLHRILCGMEYRAAQSEQALEEAKLLRKELGLDELGQTLPNHDLHLATGLGRRISACLLEVAEPFMAVVESATPQKSEMAVDIAVKIWNAAVLEAKGQGGELAALRGRIVRGGMEPTKFDAAVAIRKRRHAHDLRMIEEWKIERQAGGGFMFLAKASLEEDLVRRAREAGIESTTILPAGAGQADS